MFWASLFVSVGYGTIWLSKLMVLRDEDKQPNGLKASNNWCFLTMAGIQLDRLKNISNNMFPLSYKVKQCSCVILF